MIQSIQSVAKHFNVTYDALRFYEKRGLLPEIKRDQNGRREYSDTDLDQLDKILHLRQLGASVAETKTALDLFNASDKTIETYDLGLKFLANLETRLNQKIATLEQQKEFLAHKNKRFKTERAALMSKRVTEKSGQ